MTPKELEEAERYERLRSDHIKRLVRDNAYDLYVYWRYGDGMGGGLLDLIAAELAEAGYAVPTQADIDTGPSKKPIPRYLRKLVFERDDYRCVQCGDRWDLCADHIYPESKGGKATLDNLQTLCRSCNSKKGAVA